MSNYTIRSLKTKDIFALSRIIKALNIKFSFKEGMTAEQIGMVIMTDVIENLENAEQEMSTFLGDLVGLTAEEFSELPLEDTFDIIKQFKDIKGLSGFFTSASKLTKPQS